MTRLGKYGSIFNEEGFVLHPERDALVRFFDGAEILINPELLSAADNTELLKLLSKMQDNLQRLKERLGT